MKSVFKLLAAATTFAMTNANHPFVGEHAGATTVQRDDGSVAMKMEKRRGAAPNKYSKMIVNDLTGPPQTTVFQTVSEHIFGKSEDKLAFEEVMADIKK